MNGREWSAWRTSAVAAVMCMLVCAGLLLAVRLPGNRSIGVAVLAANTCEPQPCWQGVRPGTVPFREAAADLTHRGARFLAETGTDPCWTMPSAPLWRSCVSSPDSEPISYIDVDLPSGELRLGDALLQFGDPIGLQFCPVVNARLPDLPPRFMAAFISFPHGVWVLAYDPLHLDGDKMTVDPEMIVWQMSYHVDSAPVSDFAWHGFSVRSARNRQCIRN